MTGVVVKRCVKCAGPVPSPVLADGLEELCPLCGDEPASRADLAGLLREALSGPLVAVRDHLELRDEVWWEQSVFDNLDDALDDIDVALRTLEAYDPPPEDIRMAAWFLVVAGGDEDRVTWLRFWWGEGYSEALYGSESPIHPDDVVLRVAWRRGARAGVLARKARL